MKAFSPRSKYPRREISNSFNIIERRKSQHIERIQSNGIKSYLFNQTDLTENEIIVTVYASLPYHSMFTANVYFGPPTHGDRGHLFYLSLVYIFLLHSAILLAYT